MKGKIRSFTGQIGFYKVPEEMKNSLTYTSPFIDFFKEITDFKFHSSPPQDVYYHPIETRVDTAPIVFYWKITFTNYDGYQVNYDWSSSSTSFISLSYQQGHFQIFHPFSNIRRIELQDIEVDDNGTEIRTINSGVLYYNPSHLYSYTFPDNCIRRIIRLKFFRWEDSTPYIANITIHNTEYNYHRYPPQDVYYHPIETRIDTTPPLFYYKVIFYDAYDTQIAETEWLTSYPTIFQPFYKAKIKIFHPYSNIRKFIVENRNFYDNTLLQSTEFYYNSSHLYEYLFTIDHESMRRQIFIKAYRWEDTNPTTLWVQLFSTAIFTKIEYSTDEAADPSILAQDWTAQGGSYTFGFVKTRLHYKSTVNVEINGNYYSPSGSIDYNVHSGDDNMAPTKSYNLSTSWQSTTTTKTVSITSNGLLAKVYNDSTALTQWVNENKTVLINSAGIKKIYFHDLPSPNQNFTLYLGTVDYALAEAYIEAPRNSQRKRTISLNLQRDLDADVYYVKHLGTNVYFWKFQPDGIEYPLSFYANENNVIIIGYAQRLHPNRTIANFSKTVSYSDNQWYYWNEYPNIKAIYVGINLLTGPIITINCPWGGTGDSVRYTFTFTRPPINNSPGVFTVSIYQSSELSLSYAKYEILRLP